MLARAFRHFAGMTAERSPLYAFLSARVADTPELLALASGGRGRQPPPNLLFGAVHFLLLRGAHHPLASHYRSLGGEAPPEEAWPPFLGFCRRFRREIAEQVRIRRVQTNEVGRSGLLLPALAVAQDALGKPLHLVEIGASAGLNLGLDRYRYEYSSGHRVGGASPVVVRVEVRGADPGALPLPSHLPAIEGRIGIDLDPIDIRDRDAVTWTEALLWPCDLSRIQRHRAAVSLARERPPQVIQGDALAAVPGVVAAVPPHRLPCIFHSHTTYQMDGTWRGSFASMLDALGGQRDLAHISLEWLDDDPGPQLHLAVWRGGRRTTAHLASCDSHGRWMELLPMTKTSTGLDGRETEAEEKRCRH